MLHPTSHQTVANRAVPARLRRWHLAGPVLLLLAVLSLPVPAASAATITVNTTTDEINNDGDCSLREAIRAANLDQAVDACPAGSGADTIILPAGNYVLNLAGSGEDAAQTGDLDITADLTLSGAGSTSTTIDGNGLDRVLQIFSSTVEISGIEFTGGVSGANHGGGINLTSGTLTLSSSRVTGNGGNTGGVYVASGAQLTLTNSRVEDNSGASAGGIAVSFGAVVLISHSFLSNNTSSFSAGALLNSGNLTVVNSTISGNSAADDGGGIYSSGTTDLFNVTISNNTADRFDNGIGEGGGIYVLSGTLTARNTIIGGNFDDSTTGSQHPDCWGTFTDPSYNLIENTTGCTIAGSPSGNITGVSPNLGPLQDNGGDTQTHALLAGSPAIDAGNPAGCADQNGVDLTIDQRGALRNGRCDIGAFEYDSPAPTPTATPMPTNTPTPTNTPSPTPTATSDSAPPADHSVYLPLIRK